MKLNLQRIEALERRKADSLIGGDNVDYEQCLAHLDAEKRLSIVRAIGLQLPLPEGTDYRYIEIIGADPNRRSHSAMAWALRSLHANCTDDDVAEHAILLAAYQRLYVEMCKWQPSGEARV